MNDASVVQPATPLLSVAEPPSPFAAKLTVTGTLLLHPAAFCGGLTEAVGGFGAVLSIQIGPNDPVAAVLPALSVQVPALETEAVLPSNETVCPATLLEATSLSESVHWKETTTSSFVHVPAVYGSRQWLLNR